MEFIFYLIAICLALLHSAILTFIIQNRKKMTDKKQKNLVAIYLIYLLIMLGYMFNNLFWNFLTPEVWLEKFIWVFINPIDNLSALITACIIRAIFGEMELI